jgi:hypothetical protein
MALERIVSSGQTGAARAALEWAKERGTLHGGWCSRGRLAEDGPIPPEYKMTECPTTDYHCRTKWNVKDSDGVAIFTIRQTLSPVLERTVEFALGLRKPWLHLSAGGNGKEAAAMLRRFMKEHRIQILNVVGSKRSDEPDVGSFVKSTLTTAFDHSV